MQEQNKETSCQDRLVFVVWCSSSGHPNIKICWIFLRKTTTIIKPKNPYPLWLRYNTTGHKVETTTTSHQNSKQEEDVGQGELYARQHAARAVEAVQEQANRSEKKGLSMGLVEDIRRNLGSVKDKVLEKLAAAAVPADASESARNYLEMVVRDVSAAAQGLTKDALHRIKTHLVDILPSLSPSLATKMVDDAEKEAASEGSEAGEEETEEGNQRNLGSGTGKATPFVSPTSSLFSSLRSPLLSRL